MKRLLLTALLAFAALPLLRAERRLATADELAAFFKSTTQVVSTNDNIIVDALLNDAVRRLWKVTPFKAIDKDAFDAARTDETASFLVITRVVETKDPLKRPYLYLSLLMGHKDAATNLDNLPELASIPLASLWGTEVWLPLLDASVLFVQKHAKSSTDKGFASRLLAQFQQRLQAYNDDMAQLKGKNIYVNKSEVNIKVNLREMEANNPTLHFVDKDGISAAAKSGDANTAVAFVVYPQGKEKGAYGYKMVLGLDGTLYYYYYETKPKNFLLQGNDFDMIVRQLK
jgi:hypothetical protein